MQPAGADLHLFLDPNVTSPERLAQVTPFGFRPIVPSLEDVFIALARKEECAKCRLTTPARRFTSTSW